jgi:hypothetical protein
MRAPGDRTGARWPLRRSLSRDVARGAAGRLAAAVAPCGAARRGAPPRPGADVTAVAWSVSRRPSVSPPRAPSITSRCCVALAVASLVLAMRVARSFSPFTSFTVRLLPSRKAVLTTVRLRIGLRIYD